MGHELGALREGMLADVVVWNATSPGMVCAAVQDPVAAVVLHSSGADVEVVFVDGIVRMADDKLLRGRCGHCLRPRRREDRMAAGIPCVAEE